MSTFLSSPEKLLWKHAHAMAAMHSALDALESLEEAYTSGAQHLIESLWTAYFVTYCRPFTANREIGKISSQHVPQQYKATHRVSIAARNEIFGHTDPTPTMDDGRFLNEIALEVQGRRIVPICRSPLPSPEELGRFRDLTQAVHDSLAEEIARNLSRIPEVQLLADGLYSIDFSAPVGNRFIRIEEDIAG
jgi:hypothetical protein